MLADRELEFAPLLPDDDAPLDEQVQALALWCQGFLSGVGTTAPSAARQQRPQATPARRDSARFRRDQPRRLERGRGRGPGSTGFRARRDPGIRARQRADRVRRARRGAGRGNARRTLTITRSDSVNAKEFARRRKHLMELIGSSGIAILAAAPERVRSRDTLYIYRQDSDFFYLTGFGEPEAVAVLVPGRPQGEFLLFCRERNPDREQWDGPRAGPEGAVADYGADDAFPISDLDDILPGLLERSDRVYYSISGNEFDQKLLCVHPDVELEAPERSLAERARRARSSVARDAALQEPRRDRRHAPGGAHRRRRPQSGDARVPARHEGIRARGRVRSRVPPPRRRVLVPADRRGRRQRLHPALPRRTMRALVDGDLVLIDAGCEFEHVRVRRHAHVPRQRPVQRAAARALRGRPRRESSRPRPRPSPATTGTIRTMRPSAS